LATGADGRLTDFSKRGSSVGLRRSSFASLSGGQRQRLFIALALLNEPEVVFFDELTQGLDPLARGDVWSAIRDVRERGTTVVLVTHFMDEAEAPCDRVAVMRGGRIVDTGSPVDLIARHARTTMVTFTPPAAFRPIALADLPAVDRVERHGDRSRIAWFKDPSGNVLSFLRGR
jgi:ABC-2 type transport system ATP-binding protein